MFEKKQRISKNIKKVDAIVTGLILWGVVASIYGLSREKKEEEIVQKKADGKRSFGEILKLIIFGMPKEKPTFSERIKRIFGKK